MVLVIAVLVLASVGIMLLVRYPFGDKDTSASGGDRHTQTQQTRPLSASGEAEFVTVFVYGDDGEMAAYMVGGHTDEFSSIQDAIAGASSGTGNTDESFSDLLVFSFSDGTTMEVAYSPGLNSLSYGGSIYELQEDLGPTIKRVEERFND